ncbi:MAG: type II secretion system F family protein [Verrucomicrobiaceae bacterium]|nr:type II secretion system F family protein [Verrucomicrobiaceae bacterium]
MPSFTYSAHGPAGIVSGELSAADRAEAFALLGKKKLQPFKLEQGSAAKAVGRVGPVRPGKAKVSDAPADTTPPTGPIKLKLPQVVMFTEELSDLLAAGIQLEPALGTMERRRELSGVKTLATVLRSKIRDGMSFSKAVASTSPSFGSLFCALAAAGEASGSLPAILKRQAAYLRSLQALRGKVMFAMIYPAFLIVSAVAVTLLFIVYLIPKLTELLAETGGAMPMGATIILFISGIFKKVWWLLALGGFIGWGSFKAWLARPESKIPWARFTLKVPLFGQILKSRFYVQFLETLSNLIGSGLPMTHALQLTQQATENPYLRQELTEVMTQVSEGVSLSRALDRSGHFPPLLLDMVSVGEQTGKIAESLSKAAERFDRELEKTVDKISAIIQPAIICLMAGMVGVMAYLMVSTIFQTISGVGK